jgi:hypothetical protein
MQAASAAPVSAESAPAPSTARLSKQQQARQFCLLLSSQLLDAHDLLSCSAVSKHLLLLLQSNTSTLRIAQGDSRTLHVVLRLLARRFTKVTTLCFRFYNRSALCAALEALDFPALCAMEAEQVGPHGDEIDGVRMAGLIGALRLCSLKISDLGPLSPRAGLALVGASLVELSLSRCPTLVDYMLEDLLRAAPLLSVLQLVEVPSLVEPEIRCACLQTLCLSACVSLRAVDVSCPRLQNLTLSWSLNLLALPSCAGVRRLDLLGSQELADVNLQCPHLEWLDLRMCPNLRKVRLADCSALRHVDVGMCAELTSVDLQSATVLPELDLSMLESLQHVAIAFAPQLARVLLFGSNSLLSVHTQHCRLAVLDMDDALAARVHVSRVF